MTRKLNDEKPFLKRGLSMKDVEKFKEEVDKTKYKIPEKKRRIERRNSFEF